MNIISIDLGTTNIKVSIYSSRLSPITTLSKTVHYFRDGDNVEFDPEEYFASIYDLVKKAAAAGKEHNNNDVIQIVLTGQAESLVLLDTAGKPLRPAISWLDMRSRKECEELAQAFNSDVCYQITGQPEIIPTWPLTKMLWLRKNEPSVFNQVDKYLLLKDYIIYKLSGKMYGDYTIYSFSHYFDIINKCYWQAPLNFCGVKLEQLPQLLPPCSVAGNILPELICDASGLNEQTKINVGTLDHFAGMIGTGNITEGIISESAGTVLSIATLLNKPLFSNARIPIYCGPFPDTYVLLPVCESGGFSMEWFKNNFLIDDSYSTINEKIKAKQNRMPPIFLPYLTGVNAPDFNENASGVFYGIKAHHDKYDFALAIMEGVACLLKKNIDYMIHSGIKVDKIISTGGGAKSPLWTQIKSNITNQIIDIPEIEEAPCIGAALISAVCEGYFSSYEEAIQNCVSIKDSYQPTNNENANRTYQIFDQLYQCLQPVYSFASNK